jgi:glycosyltransferase involved in cell wall biosynthesis
MMLNIRPSIAVIVTNHNYHAYLPDALSSIQNQLLKPDEVVVVDDKSNTNCEDIVGKYGFQHIRTNFGKPLQAREYGFNATQSDWVCFLDADDRLPPGYLANAALAITKDVDIVFSDLQHFGNDNTRTNFPTDVLPKRLWQVNFLHVGCLVSRIAIILSEAFEGHPNKTNYHEDWLFWRKIVGYGFKYTKQESLYEARVHDKNRSAKIRDEYLAKRYYDDMTEVYHHFENHSVHFLKWLNKTKSINHDYIGIRRIERGRPYDWTYDWTKLAAHLDHNVAAVHDTNYKFFDRTLFVGPVLDSYLYRSAEQIPFDDKTEKIIYV